MNIDITEIIIAVIGLIGVVLTSVVVPYIKSKTSAENRAEIARWVQLAVAAAEQVITGTDMGKKKREYVLEWLKNQGIELDDEKVLEQVEILIEAFVAELNGKAKLG